MPTVPVYQRQMGQAGLVRVVEMPRPDASVFGGNQQGLSDLGRATGGVGLQMANIAVKERLDKLTADIDHDMQATKLEHNKFQNDLRLNTTDQDARAVLPAKTQEFLDKRRGELTEKYKGRGELAQKYLGRVFDSFYADSYMGAENYAFSREKEFIRQTEENKRQLAISDAGNLENSRWREGLNDAVGSSEARFGANEALAVKTLEGGRAERVKSYYSKAQSDVNQLGERALELWPSPDKNAWGKHKNISRDVQNTFKPEEYEALRTRVSKEVGERVKQDAQRQTVADVAGMLDLAAHAGELEDQKTAFMGLAADIADAEKREAVIKMGNKEYERRMQTRDAEDTVQTLNIIQQAQNALPVERLAFFDVNYTGSVHNRDQMRERVENYGATKENAANIAVADNLRRRVDEAYASGEILTENEIEQIAFMAKCTPGQIKELKEYVRQGGPDGALWQTRTKVDTALKFYTNGKKDLKKYPELYDVVRMSMVPGQKLTDNDVKVLVRNALVEGEAQGGGIGYGSDMSYAEAALSGKSDEWLPDVDKDAEARIREWGRVSGRPSMSMQDVRIRRRQEMGLPMGAFSVPRGGE